MGVISSLSAEAQELVAAAAEARKGAVAPYSKFKVGAAVRTASGEIVTGCNVEISSYSHSCCAERVALFKAVSEGARLVTECAVVTHTSPPASPCGACRQVLSDFSEELTLYLTNTDGEVTVTTLGELLPMAFKPAEVLKSIYSE